MSDRRPLPAAPLLPATTARRGRRRSPSGLLTERDWEADMAASCEPPPRAARERERRFARWVHARAKELATELDRMARPDAAPDLARQAGALAEALWADAEWARRRIDGALD